MLEILISVGDVEERFNLIIIGKDMEKLQKKFSRLKNELFSFSQIRNKKLREEVELEIHHQIQLMEKELYEEFKDDPESKDWVPFGGFYEYDQFIWGLDAKHYLQTSLNILDLQVDTTPLDQFEQKNEEKLKYIIRKAVTQLLLFKDIENPSFFPFYLYPERFWWREIEWQTAQELNAKIP